MDSQSSQSWQKAQRISFLKTKVKVNIYLAIFFLSLQSFVMQQDQDHSFLDDLENIQQNVEQFFNDVPYEGHYHHDSDLESVSESESNYDIDIADIQPLNLDETPAQQNMNAGAALDEPIFGFGDILADGDIDNIDNPIQIQQEPFQPQEPEQNIQITSEDKRRSQKQSIDMFNQPVTRFFKINPCPLFQKFLTEFKRSYHSRDYILFGLTLIYQLNDKQLSKVFVSSLVSQIKARRIKIQNQGYTSGLKLLLNIEFDYVLSAIDSVFEYNNIGKAGALIYLKNSTLSQAKAPARRGFLNACKKLNEKFGIGINTSDY